MRYLGPLVWTELNKKERTSSSIDNFRNSIRQRDLEALFKENFKKSYKAYNVHYIVGSVTFLEIFSLTFYFL